MSLHSLAMLIGCGLIAFSNPPAAAAPVQAAQAPDAARAAISRTIESYFQGHATGDPVHFRKAFLPTAHIEGIRDGIFTSWTLDAYCALFEGSPAPDEATRKRTIDLIDISGNSAIARATLDHGATVFTDYFLLLKVDGEWWIANKVYSGRPAGKG